MNKKKTLMTVMTTTLCVKPPISQYDKKFNSKNMTHTQKPFMFYIEYKYKLCLTCEEVRKVSGSIF